jgi:hypothetical protein
VNGDFTDFLLMLSIIELQGFRTVNVVTGLPERLLALKT